MIDGINEGGSSTWVLRSRSTDLSTKNIKIPPKAPSVYIILIRQYAEVDSNLQWIRLLLYLNANVV